MRLEVVVSSEAFMTFFTLEGFLARMRPFVVLQDVFVPEAAMADVARELFLFFLAIVVAAFHRYPRLCGMDTKEGVTVADVISVAVGFVPVKAETEEGVGKGRAAEAVESFVVDGWDLVDHPGGSSVRD